MQTSTDISSTITVTNYRGSNVPEDLMLQYGKMRYQCFSPDDPNVNMDNERKIELDHFDRSENMNYIMITEEEYNAESPRLLSAMRVLPTLNHYELEENSYRYLTDGCDLPKSNKIIETSRWVGKSTRTATGELMLGLINRETCMWGRANGYRTIIGVIDIRFENWFRSRDISIRRCSKPYQIKEGGRIIMIQIDLDDTYLSVANSQIVNAISTLSLSAISLKEPLAA